MGKFRMCLKRSERTGVEHACASWVAVTQACGGTISEEAVGAWLWGSLNISLKAFHFLMLVD